MQLYSYYSSFMFFSNYYNYLLHGSSMYSVAMQAISDQVHKADMQHNFGNNRMLKESRIVVE